MLERVEQRYADFGPTLASEHLDSEAGLKIPAESLRRWMREAGRVTESLGEPIIRR